MRAIAAVLLTGLALTCGSVAAGAQTQPREEPDAADRVVVVADPAILDTRPIAFESWNRTGNGIAVHFDSGAQSCYGANAVARETPSTVTVELRSGTLPTAVGMMCPMIVAEATMDVPLAAPVGDRQVISLG